MLELSHIEVIARYGLDAACVDQLLWHVLFLALDPILLLLSTGDLRRHFEYQLLKELL